MSANRDGLPKEKTPRRTTRRATATPVREVSPPAQNTRAASTALQNTPATRRSARAASRKQDQPRDVVNNNVLPEVQTRQSYAYGSSKTPIPPQQLHVRETLTMKQVADQMDSAMNRAEQNLGNYAAEVEDARMQSNTQSIRKSPNQPSPPASVTTEAQKKHRTAAWASSLDSGHLDDISEEEAEQPHNDSPETRHTDPSSFPSGVFDHSYQYERGLRPPRKPPGPEPTSLGSRFGAFIDSVVSALRELQRRLLQLGAAVGRWLSRLADTTLAALNDLPDSKIVSLLTKSFFIVLLLSLMSYSLCFGYTRYLCDSESSSRISQTVESLCGTCRTGGGHTELPLGSQPDLRKLTSALKHIESQIRSVESRFNSRLDSKVSAIHTDIDDLRKEQTSLVHQIEDVSSQASVIHTDIDDIRNEQTNLVQQIEDVSSHIGQPPSTGDAVSLIIPKINYFLPSNGASINAKLTSPTLHAPLAFYLRLTTRLLGLGRYKAKSPIAALEPWHDVGDCWCAAATLPEQDSIRLSVSTEDFLYPTEMVIEHPPIEVTPNPETAPKQVELWADFGHYSEEEWKALNIESMTALNDDVNGPLGSTYGMIGSFEHPLESKQHVIQRFALNVNQFGETKYSAKDYMIRVRTTHGGDHGCLYRVRLHGVPLGQGKDGLDATSS